MKIRTVNVIEIVSGIANGITSFKDTPAGNKEAEKLFLKLIKKHEESWTKAYKATKDDLEMYLDDGCYSVDGDDHDILIMHSI